MLQTPENVTLTEVQATAKASTTRWGLLLLRAACAAAMAALILRLGAIQFGGEDGGILTNIAWQLHLGYQPYREVVVTGLPPLFLLGAQWAVALFGMHWQAFMLFTALFVVVTFWLHVSLLERLKLGGPWALLLALATQCVTLVPISWWWFNQITAIASTLFVTAAILFIREPDERVSRVALVGTAVLLAFCKANVAGLLLGSTAVILLSSRRLRRPSLVLIPVSAVLAVLLLVVLGIHLPDLLASYRVGGGRVLNIKQFFFYFLSRSGDKQIQGIDLKARLLLLPALYACVVAYEPLKRALFGRVPADTPGLSRPLFAVACAGLFTGLVAMGTNNDFKMVEMPVMLVSITLLLLCARAVLPAQLQKLLPMLLLASAILLSCYGVYCGVRRTRILGIGLGTYYEQAALTRLATPAFFRGVSVGPRLTRVLTQVHTLLAANPALAVPDAPVYFGPRMLFCYAAFGIHPYPGMPQWWQLYTDQNPLTPAMVQRFRDAHFKVAIFLHHEYIFYPPSLQRYLHEEFTVYDRGELTIHVAKGAPPLKWR